MKPRIIITGANGYIANLVQLYNYKYFDFIPLTRRELDLSHPELVAEQVNKLGDYDVIFHTAANAQTAACEQYPALTHQINVESAIELAKCASQKKARFIFISTEQVFNAKHTGAPFTESDVTLTQSVYGLHKSEVDEWIKNNLEDFVILRFSWMFGLPFSNVCPSPNLLVNVYKALVTETKTKFTVHEKRCFTYAQRIASNFNNFLQLNSGVYHIASSNGTSADDGITTFQAAQHIAQILQDCGLAQHSNIEDLILPDYERYNEFHRDFRLDAHKAQAEGINLGTFEEDLYMCLNDFGWKLQSH